MKKIIRRAVAALCAALIISAVIFTVSAAVTAGKVYAPERKISRSSPEELGLYFDSFSASELVGRFIPAQTSDKTLTESRQTVIVSHNYADNMDMDEVSLLYTVKFLANNGYNVVTFDYSGSGASDGKGYSFGQKEETNELCKVIDAVRLERPDDEIILYGLGMGGAAAVNAAIEKDVEKIITDSLYADLSELLDSSMSFFTGSKSALFNSAVKILLPAVSPIDYAYPSPLSLLESAKDKKILLIYGENDEVLPKGTALKMRAAAEKNNEVSLFLISDCAHLYGAVKNDYNYKNVLLAFLTDAE